MSGKLFIGGLSWETTEESLKAVYQEFGEVSETQIMRDRSTGRARGFGFVTYSDPEVAAKVAGQKTMVDGREVDTKLSVPRDQIAPGSHQGSQPEPDEPPCVKIFLGGVGGLSTEETLTAYFSKYGEVAELSMMLDKHTGVSRGFGFCTFASADAAAAALKESRSHKIDDKMVEIKPAETRESCNARAAARGYNTSRGYNIDNPMYGGGNPMYGASGGPMRGGYMPDPYRGAMAPQGMYGHGYDQGYPPQGYGAPAMNYGQAPGYMQYMEQGHQQAGYSQMQTPDTWNAGYGGAAEYVPPPPEVPPPPPPHGSAYQPASGYPPPPTMQDRAHPYAR